MITGGSTACGDRRYASRPEPHATTMPDLMTDEAPPPEALVRRALAALELAAIRHRRGVRRDLRVGDEELSALLYLAHHGGVAQRRLADVTSLSRSGAGAMIQRLEERGFVQRRTDPADRRLRLVELSPPGRERVELAYREFATAAAQLLAECPPAEVAALARLLDGLAGAAHSVDDERVLANSPHSAGEPIWRHWG
jgi:DNA-binding MarR family transcriptional regulator